MAEEDSYLRKRVDELRGEAQRIRTFLGVKGEDWRGRPRAIAELQHLEAAADELEAEVDAAEDLHADRP